MVNALANADIELIMTAAFAGLPPRIVKNLPNIIKNGAAWWVPNFQFKRSGYKLTAIPETCSWFNSQQISYSGNKESKPANDVVQLLKVFHEFMNLSFNCHTNPIRYLVQCELKF